MGKIAYFGTKTMYTIVLVIFLLFNLLFINSVEASELSTIAGIEVEGLTSTEIEQHLQNDITTWLSSPVKVEGAGISYTLQEQDLQFDIAATVAQYEQMTAKPWYAFWQKKRHVKMPLQVNVSDRFYDQIVSEVAWHSDNTVSAITGQASLLGNTVIAADVVDAQALEKETLATATVSLPSDMRNADKLVARLNDVTLAPNEEISMVQLLGEDIGQYNQATLDVFASLLYKTLIYSDYEIIARTAQRSKPSYIEQGFEATIDIAGANDVIFINHGDIAGRLKVAVTKNMATMAIKVPKKTATVSVRVDDSRKVEPKIIYRYTPTMAVGTEKVIEAGSSGKRIDVYRTIRSKKDFAEELVGNNYYAPTHRIIMRSTKEQPPAKAVESKPNTGTTTNTKAPAAVDAITKQPNANNNQPNHDDLSGDKPVTDKGYYDKAGNFIPFAKKEELRQ